MELFWSLLFSSESSVPRKVLGSKSCLVTIFFFFLNKCIEFREFTALTHPPQLRGISYSGKGTPFTSSVPQGRG